MEKCIDVFISRKHFYEEIGINISHYIGVTISLILSLMKWSERDPNVKPQTFVETFDQANSNSIPRGGSRGRVPPRWPAPPPRDDPRFSNTTCILTKKNYVVYWCWSRARDECNPLLKKILDPPLIPEYICHGSPKLELTSSKRHIKTFHVVVMQGRQRNVPKRVLNLCMHPKLM